MNAYSSRFVAAVSPLPDLGSVLDRASFFGLIDTAIRVAEPGSVPVLILVDLAWRDTTIQAYGAQGTARLLQTAPARIAAALGDNGFVCALRETRLAVLAASDSGEPVDALAELILTSLACPALADETVRTPAPVLAIAQWGVDGETPEELFVAADLALHALLRAPGEEHAPTERPVPAASLLDHGTARGGLRFRPSPLQ